MKAKNTSEFSPPNPKSASRKSRKTAILMVLVVIGMFGFGFALVPLYTLMCKTLGINGKTGGATAGSALINYNRTVTVQFIANNNENLPWKFYPLVKTIEVHPGQNTKIVYFAQNDSAKTMTVQAVPSVSPGLAAKHLKKTECFCFTQQTLQSKQSMEMPLLFHLDNDLPKNIQVVTLSYTLFDVSNLLKSNTGKPQGKIN